MGPFSDYDSYDALGLAELVRAKQVSAEGLLDEAIARAERVNPKLNAIVYKRYDEARAEIRRGLSVGPFTGVPFALKDLGLALAGAPLTSGSRYFKDYVPVYDDEITTRFKAAGLS